MTNTAHLFTIISKTIYELEADLKATNNTGIFFAPELYTAFYLGKEIYQNRAAVFGMERIDWARETALGNGGISDIVFKVDDYRFVLELKLRSTIQAYESDILKLNRLTNSNYDKFLCILADSFKQDIDDRLEHLSSQYRVQIESIGHESFATWNDWYTKPIFCHLQLWRIK